MGKGTLVGVVAGLSAVFISMILEGGNPASLLAPPALVLILVGTFGAACGGTSLEAAVDALKALPAAFTDGVSGQAEALIERVGSYAATAHRDGLLALDGQLADEEDRILRAGLEQLVDGVDGHEIAAGLRTMAGAQKAVWDARADFFTKMGGYAPTLGIIGTVLGLIHTLESLGGDPAELGHLIAAAFIATFFGVTFANLVFLPVGAKFKLRGQQELKRAAMAISAVEQMGQGTNPRHLRQRLAVHLPPDAYDRVLAARVEEAS